MADYTIRRQIWRWTPGAFVLAFALSLAMFGGAGSSAPANVHGAVLQWANDHRGEEIPVVITATGDTETAAARITESGGTVKRELGIISSVQAEIPATSVRQLAASGEIGWMSLDAPVYTADGGSTNSGSGSTNSGSGSSSSGSGPASVYPQAVKAPDAWNAGYTGAGVGVAVVDTGVSPTSFTDFVDATGASRVVANVVVNTNSVTTTDGYGHGTHIAGIVTGDGDASSGKYKGVAPGAHVINVKISNDTGASGVGDLIAGLIWIYENREEYNIRVVNLSLHSSVAESYKTSPLDAAVEFLWMNDIYVVVASGNSGASFNGMKFPPANDPFVMTVGAIDDRGTTSNSDDYPPSWSSWGFTQDGFFKPEMLAPGANIVSVAEQNSTLYQQALGTNRIVQTNYLKLSGTSMSAGVMSGVAALVFEAHPDWKPGEVKCTLFTRGRALSGLYFGWRVPRAEDTINRTSPSCNSNTGIAPNRLLAGIPIVPMMGVVAYVLDQPDVVAAAEAVGLNLEEAGIPPTATLQTVDWSVIKWDAIKWDVIKWDVIKWDVIKWDVIKWDVIKWDVIKWDVIKWESIKWASIKWAVIKWDMIKWDMIKWESIKWAMIKWDVIKWDAIKWATVDFDSVAADFVDTGEAPPVDFSEDLEDVDETIVDTSVSEPATPVTPPSDPTPGDPPSGGETSTVTEPSN